jgi:rubredoxin
MAMDKYQCQVCGFIYEPENGDPDHGFKPGTRFEDLWQNQRKCGSAKQPTAAISMTRTEEIERARCPREPVSKTCLRIGNARFAVQARRCSDPWQGLDLWRLRPIRAERGGPG